MAHVVAVHRSSDHTFSKQATDSIELLAGLGVSGDALLALTGLRNPCVQIDASTEGLQGQMLGRDENGKLVRKTGVMSVVLRGGTVSTGDEILVGTPAGEPLPTEKI